MKIFAVNKMNDILARGGSLAIAHDAEALKQQLEHVMQSLFGEMIHHADKGLPYQQCIWGGSPNLRQFEAFARVALKNEAGVLRVLSFAAKKSGETLNYTAVVQTVYGEVLLHG